MVYPPGLRGISNEKPLGFVSRRQSLLGALVLGDGFGSLGDGVLGELTGEDKADCRLNLPGGHGGLLVVFAQSSCLARDPTESVGHERVQDGHGSLGDSGVRVDLLEDAVDVDVVGFSAPAHLEIGELVSLTCEEFVE